ncbi:hypothetical protein [Rubrivivax albus]|uniref:hypothetical protein n=1 Tax=Rubrivivax albus TaxID=2499835 RepID=UPI00130546D2|nr:hypothetical protein [Rubrivivax albus]
MDQVFLDCGGVEIKTPRRPPYRPPLRRLLLEIETRSECRSRYTEPSPGSIGQTQRAACLVLPAAVQADLERFNAHHPEINVLLASQDLIRNMDVGPQGEVSMPAPAGGRVVVTPPDLSDPNKIDEAIAHMWDNVYVPNPSDQLRDEIQLQAVDLELWMVAALTEMSTQDHSHTLDLLDALSMALGWPIFLTKYQLNVRRPDTRLPAGVEPWLTTPPHASFPSGHACIAQAVAVVLADLTGYRGSLLQEQATRIARNREVAGVHTALDSDFGGRLGTLLGQYAIDAAVRDAERNPRWAMLYARAAAEWVEP